MAEAAALKSNEGYSSEGGSGLEGEGGDGSASTVDEHGGATAFTAQGAFCLVRLLAALVRVRVRVNPNPNPNP